ncbi:MAG: hypothetical protein V7775_00395 [Sulfitobacter sp.]
MTYQLPRPSQRRLRSSPFWGVMAFWVALGGLLIMIGQMLSEIELFWSRYLFGFGGLFILSPLLSWYGLIFGGAFFLAAAHRGYGRWLTMVLFGMVSSILLYLPFFSTDIHPVILILYGGAMAFTFWCIAKSISRGGLISPQPH